MAEVTAATSTGLPDRSGHSATLPPDAKPPKSKTQPYYSVHPGWKDLTPIPQLDLAQPSTYTGGSNPLPEETAKRLATAGPALATIAYTPRYIEAMSYLRASMAKEELTERALALTEDIISMNPAHYTVWIYRFRILKELWGPFTETGDAGTEVVTSKGRVGFDQELKWLEKISEKNLKNYQIWHHRQSLFQLLPPNPAPTSASWVKNLLSLEPTFLRAILELDTKNYHVWSYRQWLCAHFFEHFLADPSKELEAINVMIQEDVLNNSAWNHRYFVVFGSKQNVAEQKQMRRRKQSQGPHEAAASEGASEDVHGDDADDGGDANEADIVDLDVVDRELDFVKDKIRYCPQNGSTWNYLKGIIKYADIPVVEMKEFCAEFVGPNYSFDDLDGSSGGDSEVKGVRSSQAVEMCVEIFAAVADGNPTDENAKDTVRRGLDALAQKWDPIRRKYWAWRMKGYEARWKQ